MLPSEPALRGVLILYDYSYGMEQDFHLIEILTVNSDIAIGIIVGGCALALQVILVLCWRRIINRIDKKCRHLKPRKHRTDSKIKV